MKRLIFLFLTIYFFALHLIVFPVLAEVTVEAKLNPLTFPVDRGARLTISINGTNKGADFDIPAQKNIMIQSRGQSSQFNMVNGNVTSSIAYTYLVEAQNPGQYSLPPITIRVENKSFKTKVIPFTVTQAAASPRVTQGPPQQPSGEPEEGLAFISFPVTGSYVIGEVVPITIKAYFSSKYRFQPHSLPQFTNDGVVMAPLSDKPRQYKERIGDHVYNVLEWQTSLTGIKAGSHILEMGLDASMFIPQKRRMRSPFSGRGFFDESIFNDPLFDSFFGDYERRPVKVTSPKITFRTDPLPEQNRPTHFSGAVGKFSLETEAAPLALEVGEPVTLRMTISGEGNFDRIEVPRLQDTGEWKIYAADSEHVRDDSGKTAGMRFEQAIVAKSATIREVPPVEFSYFDPEKREYVTLASKPIPISLTQNPAPTEPIVQLPGATPLAEPGSSETDQENNYDILAPIMLDLGTSHTVIKPIFLQFWFLACTGLCLLVLVFYVAARTRLAALKNNPDHQKTRDRKKMLEMDLRNLEAAVDENSCAQFYSGSRTAIQNQLGIEWGIEPSSISLNDLKNRLAQSSQLVEIFQEAENYAYGGTTIAEEKMALYYIQLKNELEELLR